MIYNVGPVSCEGHIKFISVSSIDLVFILFHAMNFFIPVIKMVHTSKSEPVMVQPVCKVIVANLVKRTWDLRST